VKNESEALAQSDQAVKADWKRCDLRCRLNVERLSIERTCAGREFQTDGEETEKEREEK